jgi:hypothetical protein
MTASRKRQDEGVPVSERALVQRINRHLKKRDAVLKATRGGQAREELGDYYVIDGARNIVSAKHVDVEALGRELGALMPYERVAVDG